MEDARIEIGRICYKGPHLSLIGDSDYGVCGSKEYATVYATIVQDYPNPRGEEYTLERVAEGIRSLVEFRESKQWDS